jgi:hypothetical protein
VPDPPMLSRQDSKKIREAESRNAMFMTSLVGTNFT